MNAYPSGGYLFITFSKAVDQASQANDLYYNFEHILTKIIIHGEEVYHPH
jgi:hypothetical protein